VRGGGGEFNSNPYGQFLNPVSLVYFTTTPAEEWSATGAA